MPTPFLLAVVLMSLSMTAVISGDQKPMTSAPVDVSISEWGCDAQQYTIPAGSAPELRVQNRADETMVFAVTGRPVFAIGVALIAAFAVWARGWFLQQWDAELRARDAGDAAAVRRLRRLHWGGMLCNAILLFAIVGSIPYVSATA